MQYWKKFLSLALFTVYRVHSTLVGAAGFLWNRVSHMLLIYSNCFISFLLAGIVILNQS